ncbi:hypothetical protein D3C86_1681920 [compost metagenome]
MVKQVSANRLIGRLKFFKISAEIVLHNLNQFLGLAVRGFKRSGELVEFAA